MLSTLVVMNEDAFDYLVTHERETDKSLLVADGPQRAALDDVLK